MAEIPPNPANDTVDPRNGFCSRTKTFRSLRPPVPLPPPTQPLSITAYIFSLLHQSAATSPPATTAFLIDFSNDRRLSYSDFIRQTNALSLSVQKSFPLLSRNDVAFIICSSCIQLPVIYFSLLSLGVIISTASPLATDSEITHMIRISKPVIAYATSSIAHKLPSLPLGTVVIDSPEFQIMMNTTTEGNYDPNRTVQIEQSDTAAILYSSGTTGLFKGVELTHRNLIALIAGFYHTRKIEDDAPVPVSLFTRPMFFVFGLVMLFRAAALGETVVLTESSGFRGMLTMLGKYKVSYMGVSPSVVVALAKLEEVANFDLSSLQVLACGGAPLGKEVSERFQARFPRVVIVQGYGLTESTGVATIMIGGEECKQYGSAGRLIWSMEAKIVDPETGEALPAGQLGEIWLRGPSVMKGYVGDDEGTTATLDPEGWLKTGDLCYFDSDGFLYIVDRLKELIKYKSYQVAPAELENLLLSNSEIIDTAVIPYPDEEAGEIPMAYVVKRPGSNISEAQIMDFIATEVAPNKRIRRVAFIDSIPRSPAGKILRRNLVNGALCGASSG